MIGHATNRIIRDSIMALSFVKAVLHALNIKRAALAAGIGSMNVSLLGAFAVLDTACNFWMVKKVFFDNATT